MNAAVIVKETDPIYIGRVMSLTLLAFAGFGLMALPMGLLADWLGERVALGVMGVGVLTVSGLCGVSLARTGSPTQWWAVWKYCGARPPCCCWP